MNVLGRGVLHTDTVAVGGYTTAVTSASVETPRGTYCSIKIAAPSLEPLPRVMTQVGVVSEDEAAASTGRFAARDDNGLVDPGADQLHALRDLYRGVLVVGLGLESHRGIWL